MILQALALVVMATAIYVGGSFAEKPEALGLHPFGFEASSGLRPAQGARWNLNKCRAIRQAILFSFHEDWERHELIDDEDLAETSRIMCGADVLLEGGDDWIDMRNSDSRQRIMCDAEQFLCRGWPDYDYVSREMDEQATVEEGERAFPTVKSFRSEWDTTCTYFLESEPDKLTDRAREACARLTEEEYTSCNEVSAYGVSCVTAE